MPAYLTDPDHFEDSPIRIYSYFWVDEKFQVWTHDGGFLDEIYDAYWRWETENPVGFQWVGEKWNPWPGACWKFLVAVSDLVGPGTRPYPNEKIFGDCTNPSNVKAILWEARKRNPKTRAVVD